jgi:hypothetical protein
VTHLTQRRPPAHHHHLAPDGGAGQTGIVQLARRTGSIDLVKRLMEHKRVAARSPHHQVSVEVPLLPQVSPTQKRVTLGSHSVNKLSRRTIPEPVRHARRVA